MPDTTLNVLLKFVDNASSEIKKVMDNFAQGTTKVANASRESGLHIRALGRDISQVGSVMMFTGAAISGPFILALKNTQKTLPEVNQAVSRLQNSFNLIQETIAKAVVPVVNKFTDELNKLYNAFMSVSPGIREMILQGIFLTGIFLTIGGTLDFVIGKIVSMVGNLKMILSNILTFAVANGPLLLILAAIIAIGIAMWKWKEVANAVMSGMELAFLTIKNGLITFKIGIETVLLAIIEKIQIVADKIALIPGPWQNAMQNIARSVDGLSNSLRNGLERDLQGVADNAEEMGRILQTGEGVWSKGFDKLKISIQGVLDKMKEGKKDVPASANLWKLGYDGVGDSVVALGSAMMGLAAQHKSFAKAAGAITLAGAISTGASVVIHAFNTQPFFPLGLIMGALATGLVAAQIATITSQAGFAHGTDTVPAMLTPGEMIFPRSMSDAIRAGDISVTGRGGSHSSETTYNQPHIYIDHANFTTEEDTQAVFLSLSRMLDQRRRSRI